MGKVFAALLVGTLALGALAGLGALAFALAQRKPPEYLPTAAFKLPPADARLVDRVAAKTVVEYLRHLDPRLDEAQRARDKQHREVNRADKARGKTLPTYLFVDAVGPERIADERVEALALGRLAARGGYALLRHQSAFVRLYAADYVAMLDPASAERLFPLLADKAPLDFAAHSDMLGEPADMRKVVIDLLCEHMAKHPPMRKLLERARADWRLWEAHARIDQCFRLSSAP